MPQILTPRTGPSRHSVHCSFHASSQLSLQTFQAHSGITSKMELMVISGSHNQQGVHCLKESHSLVYIAKLSDYQRGPQFRRVLAAESSSFWELCLKCWA